MNSEPQSPSLILAFQQSIKSEDPEYYSSPNVTWSIPRTQILLSFEPLHFLTPNRNKQPLGTGPRVTLQLPLQALHPVQDPACAVPPQPTPLVSPRPFPTCWKHLRRVQASRQTLGQAGQKQKLTRPGMLRHRPPPMDVLQGSPERQTALPKSSRKKVALGLC